MIAGANRIVAEMRIVRHLLDVTANEEVEVTASRGLAAADLPGMVAEMELLSFHDAPLYHWHANPDPALGRDMTEAEWSAYWWGVEFEFGLWLAAYIEVRHVKHGRSHRHRLYLLSRPDGTIVPIDNDFLHRELVSRVTEIETGQPITAGKHNRWVVAQLRERGHHEIADRLVAAGITTCARPAALSPRDRQIDARHSYKKADVYQVAWAAWSSADDWKSFSAALQQNGFVVAMGNKLPVIVAPDGGLHRLAQAISGGAKLAGLDPVRAAAVYARLADGPLPSVEDAKTLLVGGGTKPNEGVANAETSISELKVIPAPDQGEDVALRPGSRPPRGPADIGWRWSTQRVVQQAPVLPRPENRAIGGRYRRPNWPVTQRGARRAPKTAPLEGARPKSPPSAGRPASPIRPPNVAALAELEQIRARTVQRVQWFRREVDDGIREDVGRQRLLEQRRDTLLAEAAAPSVGTPQWRQRWRAEMAGMPAEWGAAISWVERLEASRVLIKIGELELLGAEDRITCRDAGISAIEPMLAYAAAHGWTILTVTGGTADWREPAIAAALRAGFQVLGAAPLPGFVVETNAEDDTPRPGWP